MLKVFDICMLLLALFDEMLCQILLPLVRLVVHFLLL